MFKLEVYAAAAGDADPYFELSEHVNETLGMLVCRGDGTNAGTVIIRENDASGDIVCQAEGKVETMTVLKGPFQTPTPGTRRFHYTVTGTGFNVDIYKAVPTH